MTVESIEYKGYIIKVEHDEDAQNPRTEFDNFGKIICFHKRYDLGDKKTEEYEQDPKTFMDWIKHHTGKDIVSCPIFLFDHSGITLSTTDSTFMACDPQRWDWGLVGWIYATKFDIRKEWGKKKVNKSLCVKTIELLMGEIKTYNDYITGRVYGYIIIRDDPEVEDDVIDSCWGFYGDYNNYMIPEAKSFIDSLDETEK